MPAVNGRISSKSSPSLRADARRNRQQVLAAAAQVFVEQGADAPLDDIARRAGVGIATLYRRFPDRAALWRAVALDVMAQTALEAHAAEAEEADPFDGLARYMHRALDLRVSAVMPALLDRISFADAELRLASQQAVAPVLRLIDAAQAAGRLRSDVAFGDIGVLLVRLSRPLPGPFAPELDLRLAHRHLDLVLTALEAHPETTTAQTPLSGPRLTLAELQGLGDDTQPRSKEG